MKIISRVRDVLLDVQLLLEQSDFWKCQKEKPTFTVGDRIRMNLDGRKGQIESWCYTPDFVQWGIVWDEPDAGWPREHFIFPNRPGYGLEEVASKAVKMNDPLI